MLGNALAGPFVGVSCFQWALATTPTAIVLPVVATTPLVVIPFARFAEGDQLARDRWLGQQWQFSVLLFLLTRLKANALRRIGR
jgi:drug/metabolite transporter (DMT)-like permease